MSAALPQLNLVSPQRQRCSQRRALSFALPRTLHPILAIVALLLPLFCVSAVGATPLGQCLDIDLSSSQQMSVDHGVSLKVSLVSQVLETSHVAMTDIEALELLAGCDADEAEDNALCTDLSELDSSNLETSHIPSPFSYFGDACFDYPVRCRGVPAPNSMNLAPGGAPGASSGIELLLIVPRGHARPVSFFAHTGLRFAAGVSARIKYPPRAT